MRYETVCTCSRTVNVTPENVDRLFDEVCRSPSPTDFKWPVVDRVKSLFRNAAKDDFVSKIIVEADAKDDRLDEIRSIIYEACLVLPCYPYPKDIELKRRKKTKKR